MVGVPQQVFGLQNVIKREMMLQLNDHYSNLHWLSDEIYAEKLILIRSINV